MYPDYLILAQAARDTCNYDGRSISNHLKLIGDLFSSYARSGHCTAMHPAMAHIMESMRLICIALQWVRLRHPAT